MCLALPARVIELLPAAMAKIDLGGVIKTVSIALVDDVAVDDYLLIHVGHALGKVDSVEAENTLARFAEMTAA